MSTVLTRFWRKAPSCSALVSDLARIIHGASTAAVDLDPLTGVLVPLRRSVQHRLRLSALQVRVKRPICAASLRTFANNAG